MALYHLGFDLWFFGYLPRDFINNIGFILLARIVAGAFLFIAGFCLYLAHAHSIHWRAFARRFLILCTAALLISLTSFLFAPEQFIYFGILHQLAMSSLIGLVFLRTPLTLNFLMAAALILLPFYATPFQQPWLLFLGLNRVTAASLDYVPLFPWGSLGILGLSCARLFEHHALLHWLQGSDHPRPWHIKLQWLGRHSLALYLIHQPVFIALIYGTTLISGLISGLIFGQ